MQKVPEFLKCAVFVRFIIAAGSKAFSLMVSHTHFNVSNCPILHMIKRYLFWHNNIIPKLAGQ